MIKILLILLFSCCLGIFSVNCIENDSAHDCLENSPTELIGPELNSQDTNGIHENTKRETKQEKENYFEMSRKANGTIAELKEKLEEIKAEKKNLKYYLDQSRRYHSSTMEWNTEISHFLSQCCPLHYKGSNQKIVGTYEKEVNQTGYKNIMLKACESGNIIVVVGLINLGMHVNKDLEDDYDEYSKYTCLHYAAANNHVTLANVLIQRGASINAQDNMKLTPAIVAVNNQNLDTLETLINAGADLTIKNDKHETALRISILYNYTETIDLINMHSNKKIINLYGIKEDLTDNVEIMLRACYNGEITILKSLLELGQDVNTILPDNINSTCLHHTAMNNYVHLTKILLINNANVDATTSENSTPAWFAASWGYLDLLKLLVTNGADLSIKNEINNSTALGEARKFRKRSVINYLVSIRAPE